MNTGGVLHTNDAGNKAYYTDDVTGVSIVTVSDMGEMKQPTASSPKDSDGLPYSQWGDDNLFPQSTEKLIKANTILASTLPKQGQILYGKGVAPCRVEGYNDMNEEIIKPFVPDEGLKKIHDQISNSGYLEYACESFYKFYNIFPRIHLSIDRSKIVGISYVRTTWCRWGKPNKKGIINKCYVNANWDSDPNDYKTIPVIDKSVDPIEFLKNDNKHEYIFPISYPTENFFYALAPWNSAVESGWYDIAQEIPRFKKAMFNNQISIKYHIEIHEKWWNFKYKGFSDMTGGERRKIMEKERDNFQAVMSGADKSQMTLLTSALFDPMTQQTIPGWKITPIDDKLKSDIYIEDGKEANQNLLYAIGLDSSIVGAAPGNMNSSGSGSDKEAAIRIYLNSCQMHQNIILAPIRFTYQYNGYDDVFPRFKHTITSTVNKGSTKTEKV